MMAVSNAVKPNVLSLCRFILHVVMASPVTNRGRFYHPPIQRPKHMTTKLSKCETKSLNLVIASVNLLASTLLKPFQQQTGEKSCLVLACRGVLMSWNFIYTDKTVVSKCQSIFIQISTTPLQCFLHLWGLQQRKKYNPDNKIHYSDFSPSFG